MTTERNYLSDPRAASVEGVMASLEILSKYLPHGKQSKYFLQGEHDIIYSYVERSITSEEDARALEALGWHVSDGHWSMHT